jgi:EpsD family peptidyl-prolyl cis-trans isomerase
MKRLTLLKMLRNVAPGLIVIAVSACSGSDAPSGQVIASVDGDEITQSELDTERGFAPRPLNPQDQLSADRLTVQRLIDRKLWAHEAQRRKIDRSSAFILQQRRANEMLLANDLAHKIEQDVDQPNAKNIQDYIRGRPWVFADRAIYYVDQISIGPLEDAVQKRLATGADMAQVTNLLRNAGIVYVRRSAAVDSAYLSRNESDKLSASQNGKPVVLPSADGFVIEKTTSAKKVEMTDEERAALATNLIQKQLAAQSLFDFGQSLRRGVDINYARGYAPNP